MKQAAGPPPPPLPAWSQPVRDDQKHLNKQTAGI
jgi:hypothetical protein